RSLAEGRLFWHTTGLSIDEDDQPQLAEHFGIATVEAMRAGCVPIVIASGGQREIVEDGISGFLVSNIPELLERSFALARLPELLADLSEHARLRSLLFSRESFEHRLNEIVTNCLRSCRDGSLTQRKRNDGP